MRVYRASRKPRRFFDPLDASASVARDGWRFNDPRTPILYTAQVQALAVLEVVARPGWESVQELVVASIEVPDQSIVDLGDLGITLPTNWNQRPAARHAQAIGGEFLAAVDRRRDADPAIHGVRVPSLVSTSDCNVLLDPRRSDRYAVAAWSRIPFDWLRGTAT